METQDEREQICKIALNDAMKMGLDYVSGKAAALAVVKKIMPNFRVNDGVWGRACKSNKAARGILINDGIRKNVNSKKPKSTLARKNGGHLTAGKYIFTISEKLDYELMDEGCDTNQDLVIEKLKAQIANLKRENQLLEELSNLRKGIK